MGEFITLQSETAGTITNDTMPKAALAWALGQIASPVGLSSEQVALVTAVNHLKPVESSKQPTV